MEYEKIKFKAATLKERATALAEHAEDGEIDKVLIVLKDVKYSIEKLEKLLNERNSVDERKDFTKDLGRECNCYNQSTTGGLKLCDGNCRW